MAYRAVGPILFLLALGYAHLITHQGDFVIYGKKVSKDELREMVPRAATFERRSTPCRHWEALGRPQGKKPIAYVILSTDVVKTSGYGGPIELLLALDEKGSIENLRIRAHQETPSYVMTLFDKDNLLRLNGKDGENVAPALNTLDGKSGATMSAKALSSTIKACLRGFSGQGPKEQGQGAQMAPHKGPLALSTLVTSLFVILAYSLAYLAFVKKKSGLRKLTFLISLGLALFGLFLSMEGLLPLLVKGDFNCFNNYPWLLLLLVAFLFALFRGRLFCGHICPFGALQELLSTLTNSNHRATSPRLPYLRQLRFLFLSAIILMACHVHTLASFNPDPIFLLFTRQKETSAIILVAFIGLSTLLTCRLWCRCFCPLGALLSITSSCAPPPVSLCENCSDCGLCYRKCPVGAIRNQEGRARVNCADCIMCGKCVELCAQKRIGTSEVGNDESNEEGSRE